ncbi:MAG: caspase family protein, partial [Gammaproteobacteria bacterium]
AGMGALQDPRNDAQSMQRVLRDLSFKVHLGLDLDRAGMERILGEFEEDLIKEKADVGLLYYSGHGLQIDGANYLVAVGERLPQAEALSGLVPLDELIARMSDKAKTCLVLLDACRSNPFAAPLTDTVRQSKGIKRLYVGEEETLVAAPTGLAEIKTKAGTLIAFAAAPGEVAYEGMGDHSTFTERLLKHIEMTDLSINNLMIRARNDVLRATQGRQKTWDHSSLTAPFFFKPGSLILLMGNAIGLLAFLVSLAPQAFLLAAQQSAGWILTGFVIAAVTFWLFLSGLQRAYRLLRGETGARPLEGGEPSNHRFEVPWRQAVYGGFFGGIFAGFPIAIALPYYSLWWLVPKWNPNEWAKMLQQYPPELTNQPAFGRLLTEITITCVAVGILLGLFVLTLANAFTALQPQIEARLPGASYVLNRFTAGLVGGCLVGGLAGPFIALYFTNKYYILIEPRVVLPGAMLGAAITVFSMLNYSIEHYSSRKLRRRIIAALGATIVVAVVLGSLYWVFGRVIDPYLLYPVMALLVSETTVPTRSLLIGGSLYGALIATVLGAVTALTLIWSERRERSQPTPS